MMQMKFTRNFCIFTLALVFSSVLVSCKPDGVKGKSGEDQFNVIVKAALPQGAEVATLSLKVVDTRTLKETTLPVELPSLQVQSKLSAGTYNFSFSGKTVDDRALIGIKEAVVVHQDMDLSIPIELGEAPKCHLAFGDLFFNGETNAHMMHPDQYFMVVNNGEETEYLDGLIFSVTAHANPLAESEFLKWTQEKNEVPLSSMLQFPGSGRDYPLAPGAYVIVAATAINHHSEEQPNSVDLSGADFEVVFPDKDLPNGYQVRDTDNPDVPNLKVIYDSFSGMAIAHPRGFWPMLLFRVKGDLESFLQQHVMQVKNREGQLVNYYTVPTELIIDGVETGCEGQFKTRALPGTVDQGNFFVTGCHRQELAKRKTEQRNGRTYWIDTNNSTNDYVRVDGQTAYPKK